ncbi:hypothetical protein AWW72_17280 [Acinetobacter sp. NRRL B-65365]|nr:hypothetical protein AWW72_17280 [Acinetobacter sp. NRRL B-65365]
MWQLFCQSVTVLIWIVKFEFKLLNNISFFYIKHSIKSTCVFYSKKGDKLIRIKYNQIYQSIKMDFPLKSAPFLGRNGKSYKICYSFENKYFD